MSTAKEIPLAIMSDKGQAFFVDVLSAGMKGQWPHHVGPGLDKALYELRDKHGASAYREFMRFIAAENGFPVEDKYKAQ